MHTRSTTWPHEETWKNFNNSLMYAKKKCNWTHNVDGPNKPKTKPWTDSGSDVALRIQNDDIWTQCSRFALMCTKFVMFQFRKLCFDAHMQKHPHHSKLCAADEATTLVHQLAGKVSRCGPRGIGWRCYCSSWSPYTRTDSLHIVSFATWETRACTRMLQIISTCIVRFPLSYLPHISSSKHLKALKYGKCSLKLCRINGSNLMFHYFFELRKNPKMARFFSLVQCRDMMKNGGK